MEEKLVNPSKLNVFMFIFTLDIQKSYKIVNSIELPLFASLRNIEGRYLENLLEGTEHPQVPVVNTYINSQLLTVMNIGTSQTY